MTNVYLSEATAHQAEKIQADHAADEDGWCGFCLHHFGVQVPFGMCSPYQLARGFIDEYERQKARPASSEAPVLLVEFIRRPGQRLWTAGT